MSAARRVRVIAFARVPVPGATKTRMIPALGPDGAAALQAAMTAHTLRTVRAFAGAGAGGDAVEIEVRYTGGDADAARASFGADPRLVDQGDGDLGMRMLRAIASAADDGCNAIVIGTDCPAISIAILKEAADVLATDGADVVVGSAVDGGYYLIAMRQPHPRLFMDIAWGTGSVRDETHKRADALGCRVYLLPELRDVDRPEDLAEWERFASR